MIINKLKQWRNNIIKKANTLKVKDELHKEILSGVSVIGIENRQQINKVMLPNSSVDYIYIYIKDEGIFVKLTNDMRSRQAITASKSLKSQPKNSDEQ